MPDTSSLPANGGPAFPSYEKFEDGHLKVTKPKTDGITVLDYFAAKALVGELAAQSAETGEWQRGSFSKLAEHCFDIADAMLTERAKREVSET